MIDAPCAVGFSGHRDLPNRELVERQIDHLLDEIARKTSRSVVGVCSAAIGADMIFIEACLRRKLPWIAILPMPPAVFFNEKDFPDEPSRRNAMRLLEKAASVEITNPMREVSDQAERKYRHVAFSDSGRRIVDYCDVFIGALRHTQDPLKPGGTGDITKYARLCRRPVAIINPDTGAVEHHGWDMPSESEIVREIRSLPEAPLRQDLLGAGGGPELRLVIDFFSRVTTAARHRVPRVRNISSSAAILNGALAVLTLALVLTPWFSGKAHSIVDKGVTVLSFLAAFVTGWFIFVQPQKRAAHYRLAAEVCRSLIVTWNLPETHREIFRGLPREYGELVRTFLTYRRLDGPTLEKLEVREDDDEDSWKTPVLEYIRDRVKKQIDYYEGEQQKARRRLHIFKPLIAIFALGNFFLAISVAIAEKISGHPVIGEEGKSVVAFFKVAFPVVTATFLAILAAREANRRQGRYGEMLEILHETAARLKAAPHFKAACEVVIDNERALLAESIEWANAAKYPATS